MTPPTQPAGAATAPLPHVLLVEDSDTQALHLSAILRSGGFSVERSDSGETALEALNHRVPDLLIADLNLPGMDGRELSRRVRLNPRTRDVPLLMLTAAEELDVEQRGLESGADAYAPKSSDPDLLILRLKALLRHGGGARAQEPAPDFPAFRRGSILVVHDSATMRLRYASVFSQDGYEVSTAASAEDAMTVARAGGLDGVVVQLSGPSLDGLALCAELNALRRGLGDEAAFHIVGVTAESEAKSVLAAAFSAGVDDVISSAAGDEALRLRARVLLRRKTLGDERRRMEAEARARDVEVAAARAEAQAAEALKRANAELEAANRQIIETQARLVQAAKMASLGELVAGIAHEINNPLAFILGHADTIDRALLEAREDASEPVAAKLGKATDRLSSMRMGLKRIQDLVQNLRRFSRLDDRAPETLNAVEGIESVLTLLGHKLSNRIEVRRRFEAERPLYASAALINQVVMNIVGNAADAIEGDGVIEIATHDAPGAYVIEISDSGPGVPPDLRDRVFEPFFTTKPVGTGTGLGLAIAYSVVEAHHGTISIDTSDLGGARFVLTIPAKAS